MTFAPLSRMLRVELSAPAYIGALPAGIDISMSGIKFATIKEGRHGLELDSCGERHLPPGVWVNGDIVEPAVIMKELSLLSEEFGITTAHVSLPEAKGHLFEADVPVLSGGLSHTPKEQWRIAVEQRLGEYVPLPPKDVAFDVMDASTETQAGHVVGIGYAKRVVTEALSVMSGAGITVASFDPEVCALPRALMAPESRETVLIIDIGKTTSKLIVTEGRIPRFATTLSIGGHALTLAVQKHFGVSEADARRIKVTRGLAGGEDGDDYVAALLPTLSALREEVTRRLDYWQTRVATTPGLSPITRALVVGGNSSLAGLPEYFEAGLSMPVALADVFTHFAPRNHWLPPLEYSESLAYGTVIGLALRGHTTYVE